MLPSTTHKVRKELNLASETPDFPVTSAVNPLPETTSNSEREDQATTLSQTQTSANKRISGKAHLTNKYDETLSELQEAASKLEQIVNKQQTTPPLNEKSVGEQLDH